ncbi:MAG: signal peptide peptidase SppA [Desulfobulbaceae bacterium]|nr:signal peptide peptidase SppA [Desulfobulbaceae bacterium]
MRIADTFRKKHPAASIIISLGAVFLCSWVVVSVLLPLFPSSEEGQEIFLSSGKIGVVEVKGVITSADSVIRDLSEFRKDRHIRAIILRIDSPGGAVGASQEIFTEVKRTNQLKPVVASMGSVAASGGYYAALGARKILANPGTLTGSIGVIVKFPNLTEIFDKIGYRSEVIKSGNLKDIGAMNRPMTAEEKALLQDIIDNVHRQFVEAVAESRKLPRAQVEKLADGRIFSGEMALKSGLIDQFGNFNDAVIEASKLAGMKNALPPLVYASAKDFSLLRLFLGDSGEATWQGLAALYPSLSYELNFNH